MTTAKYSVSIDSVDVGTVTGQSTVINYGDFESGMVHIPTGSSLTTLTWNVSSSEGGTYIPARNADGAITQTVSGGNAYPIPSDLRGARFLKITGDGDEIVSVTLKD